MNDKLEALKESLEKAEETKDVVKITNCALDLGLYLLSEGKLPQAEMQFTRIIKLADKHKENEEFQKILAETYLVRGNILMGKSLYSQAVYLLELAISLFSKFKNNKRLASAHRVLSKAYLSLDNNKKAEEMEKMAKYYSDKEEC
jgi:tetratricopeptide (TPR) repeat protein